MNRGGLGGIYTVQGDYVPSASWRIRFPKAERLNGEAVKAYRNVQVRLTKDADVFFDDLET